MRILQLTHPSVILCNILALVAITPKSLVLDLFRVVPPEREVAVRDLVAITALFDISDNATRVAVARLASAGVLESARRGHYTLTANAARLGDWVEAWRRGDRRLRPWSGGWLAAALPPGLDRSARGRSLRALDRFGFRPEVANLVVRPDNLAAPTDALREQLADHGVEPGAELFVMRELSPDLAGRFAALWPIDAIERARRDQSAALRASAARLAARPPADALVESFVLGGEAIRLLARDPLLPEEIACGDARRELTEVMLDYDRLGRTLWAEALHIARAPAHTAEAMSA